MIEHQATILCEYIVPQPGGNHTLVSIYNNIGSNTWPALKAPFCILIDIQGEPKEAYHVDLDGPPGRVTIAEGVITDVPDNLNENQMWGISMVIQGQAQLFPVPGIYAIVLMSGDTQIHRREFGVFEVPNLKAAVSGN